MRVIAGSLKGRRLLGPRRSDLRPTSDQVKEALFSIAGAWIPNAAVLDLYAGTGAIGIEALSRGARRVTFVESDPAALRLLRANLARCALSHGVGIHAGRVGKFLRHRASWNGPYDVVFADPPYASEEELIGLANWLDEGLVADDAIAIVEHASKTPVPEMLGPLIRIRSYRYGDTSLTLYRRQGEVGRIP
jgi:16S rRNA (guanine966-N2)-methyltransferase